MIKEVEKTNKSVAIIKEVKAKKCFSPIRSHKSLKHVRNESDRQLGSLRDVVDNRHDGGIPSIDSIATELSGMYTMQRAPVRLVFQQTH